MSRDQGVRDEIRSVLTRVQNEGKPGTSYAVLVGVLELIINSDFMNLANIDPIEHISPNPLSQSSTKSFDIPVAFLCNQLRCGVCAGFLSDPVMLMCCSKRFCQECIESFVTDG